MKSSDPRLIQRNPSTFAERAMTEGAFQEQVIDLAHLRRWTIAHFRSVKVTRADGSTYWQTPVQADGAGFPDLVLVRDGRLIFAELKRESGKLTPEQEGWLELLRATSAGVYVFRPSDWALIEELLR